MKQREKGYGLWFIMTMVFFLAAVSTLIPQASASKPCILGYHAHCSFTPVGTIICIVVAGLACVFRKKKYTEEQ